MKIKLLTKHIYIRIVYFLVNGFVLEPKIRAKLFGKLLSDIVISSNVSIRNNVVLYNGSLLTGRLSVGYNCFFNEECFIDYSSEVKIGNNVTVGMRTMILSSTHSIAYPIRCGIVRNKTTIIEDNCWIGAGVIIYPGVHIGKGCVVAAGEVVYENIPNDILLKKGVMKNLRRDIKE